MPLRGTFIFQFDAGQKNFLKLQIKNTGSFSSAKMKVFASKSRAKTAFSTSMCTLFISHTRRIKHCRYYSMPLHDPLNVILMQRRFLNSRCFKVEITGSKLEENVRVIHAIILQRVYWAIAMCTFCSVGQIYPHGTQMRGNFPKSALAAYQNILSVAGE